MQNLFSPSIIALILANLVPLCGVLFLGWQAFPIIFLFWAENIIVGFFNILKILFACPGEPLKWLAKIFMIPFFCVHYGMFCLVHGFFVVALFGKGYLEGVSGNSMPLGAMGVILTKEDGIIYALLALFLSHGFSFVYNYIKGGEFKGVSLEALMQKPYSRIVILHITLLLGAFLIMAFKTTTIGVLILIVLKIIVDVKAHQHEHKKILPASV